ncbi:hypothetical protein PagCFBP13532_10060 [Pantoea agglomerans]|nr:hypothetical protein PagCFBP13505_18015 [Pantoea agglomerans]TKK16607.1 hypothetical protein PagCFBP13516_17390 [Pantoea agglomerans]TKK35508.1 hypothetical protein PagCFBP13532_10060 [Pantoea agglomerans]
MARLRAHLRDEVRNRAGRAARDGFSDFPICPCYLSLHSLTAGRDTLFNNLTPSHPGWRFYSHPSSPHLLSTPVFILL